MLCVSCSSQEQRAFVAPTEAVSTPEENQFSALTINQQKIKFRLNGVKAFALKPEADGMKLVDSNKKDLAWFEVDNQQNITIKNSAERIIGYIISGKNNWQIKSLGNTEKTYILQQQGNSNYQFKNGTNQEIYKIKARKDGLAIETPNHQLLYQIQVKNGKVYLKNVSTQTVLSTNSQLMPIAIACFGFKVLSREQQAALAYAVKISGE